METTISIYLFIPFTAWILSQSLKYFVQGLKSNSLTNYRQLYKSGDMPSSHSALVVALLATIGAKNGIHSVEFAIVAVLALVVLYDAVNVRRAVGEQGVVITRLLQSKKKKESFYTAKGHTLMEVGAGSLIGFTVALIMLRFL